MNTELLQENSALREAINQMLSVLTNGNDALKSAFSIGNTVTMEANEKALMSEMSVENEGNAASTGKEASEEPKMDQ